MVAFRVEDKVRYSLQLDLSHHFECVVSSFLQLNPPLAWHVCFQKRKEGEKDANTPHSKLKCKHKAMSCVCL